LFVWVEQRSGARDALGFSAGRGTVINEQHVGRSEACGGFDLRDGQAAKDRFGDAPFVWAVAEAHCTLHPGDAAPKFLQGRLLASPLGHEMDDVDPPGLTDSIDSSGPLF
jgi:hypothetical protein